MIYVYPSDYGWLVFLKLRDVLNSFHKVLQKLERNFVSISEMIEASHVDE